MQMPAESLDSYQNQQPLVMTANIRWQREEEGRQICGLEFADPNASQRERLTQIFDFYNRAAKYAN